jgi:uncharacterized protein (DUF1800 family)
MLDAWNTSGGEIRSVLRALFTSDAFTPERATSAHIKNPAAWTIGAIRGLEADFTGDQIVLMLQAQGMRLFYPPNVGGWPNGPAWISPSNQVLRFNLAGGMVMKSGNLTGAADDAWVGQLADMLGGIPIADDVRGKLTALGNVPNGRRAVAQVILAGPGFQAR